MNGLSIVGWLGVFALFTSVAVTLTAAFRVRRTRGFWLAIAALLIAVTVYRFLNLEPVLTNKMRGIAYSEQVYEQRRVPQAILVSIILVIGTAFAFWLVWWKRALQYKVAIGLIAALIGLYAVRMLSLHMVDSLLYASLGPIHLNYLVEGTVLAGICGAAWIDMQQKWRVS